MHIVVAQTTFKITAKFVEASTELLNLNRHIHYFATSLSNVSFRSPSLFYLLTTGVEVVYLHLITLRHASQSVGRL
jgi:hypothetical protein